MLVVSRKENQSVLIGDNILVKVIRIDGNTIKLGIDAPQEIKVDRQEVRERALAESKPHDAKPV